MNHPTISPFLRNLLIFGRLLRAVGLRVTSGQLMEVAVGLDFIEIGRREDFRNVARSLLVSRRDDLELFDRAFDIFWRAQERGEPLEERIPELARQVRGDEDQVPPIERPGFRTGPTFTQATEEEEGSEGEAAQLTYSPGEALAEKDFALFTAAELAEAKRFMAQMRWTLALRRSLRLEPARRGRRFDARRSLRRSLRHGGELMFLAQRGPKMKRRPLVLLCDVSGSMDRYTRLLLHFLHAVEHSLRHAEVFVFGTRLTRITRALQRRDPDAALAAVAAGVQDWSGGTRIGDALATFNHRWARRVMGQGPIVLIISDGWDRGDPRLLAAEMERLQRQSYRLIWLNPLLGSPLYEPLTQGMQAALPYIDDFLPVHNLASLRSLAMLLDEIQEGRPARKQAPRAIISEEAG